MGNGTGNLRGDDSLSYRFYDAVKGGAAAAGRGLNLHRRQFGRSVRGGFRVGQSADDHRARREHGHEDRPSLFERGDLNS